MLQKSVPILKAAQIMREVNKREDLEVKVHEVRAVLRQRLKLGWRTAKPLPVQCNSERCRVLRQQYALKIMPLLR